MSEYLYRKKEVFEDMAKERISMRKIREALRLMEELGD